MSLYERVPAAVRAGRDPGAEAAAATRRARAV